MSAILKKIIFYEISLKRQTPLKRQFWWNVPCLALFLIGELV